MSKRIVIIGAGPGGLASAMLLRAAGFDVRVLERLDRVGGRTSTLREGGFRFDMGPTFFLYPQILGEIFTACGYDLNQELDMVRVDPHYRLQFEGGGEFLATADVERLKAEIAGICPADAAGVDRYMADNRAKLEAFQPILQSPFNGLGDVLRLPLARLLPLMRPMSSVDSDLKRYFSDPRTRLAFSFQSKYLGMSPFQCPSLFTILSFIEYEHGVFHPRGGCGAVSETMARLAADMGARIHLQEPVEEILFEGRRAVGVRTSEGTYACDALMVNADFARAMTRLVPDGLRRRWRDRSLSRRKYSCSTYMMYLGVRGTYENLAHHNIFLAEDYQRNLDEIERLHVLSENPSLYVHNPSLIDPSMAPPGMSSLYVLVPVTHEHGNVRWAEREPAFRDLVYRQLGKLGLGDLRERVVLERTLTPAGWDVDMEIYRGATFNLAHSLDQMLHLRPRNRFDELDGVYLVGGGTHPGSGLPVIYESARISSTLLARDLGGSLPRSGWLGRPHAAVGSPAAAGWPHAARGALAEPS